MRDISTVSDRAAQPPLVDLDSTIPGIGAVFARLPAVGQAARELAQALLVTEIPDVTLIRAERELIAAYVSARNGCVYCTYSHGAVVARQFELAGLHFDSSQLTASLETGGLQQVDGIDDRMQALLTIAGNVQRGGLLNTAEDVQAAISLGATQADVLLTIEIAAAFCMYNRLVDGAMAVTPADENFYASTAVRLDLGYLPPSPR